MPAQRAHSEISKAGDDPWIMTCLQRADGPPLRFKGYVICDLKNGDVFAQVWQRKKGGLVLYYADLSTGELRPHALVLEDITEVAQYLEDLCQYQLEMQQSGLSELAVGQVLATLRYTQNFHPLVGELLDEVAQNAVPRPYNEMNQEAR